MPAKDVLITGQYIHPIDATLSPTITPPFPFDVATNSNIQFITIKRPIAPRDTIQVTFSGSPKVVWVSTEYGETSTLITGAHAYMVNNQTQEETPLEIVPNSKWHTKSKLLKLR